MKVDKKTLTTMRILRSQKFSFSKIAQRVGISKTYCQFLLKPELRLREKSRYKKVDERKLTLGKEMHDKIKQSYSVSKVLKKVALEYGVSATTVKRIVNPDFAKKDNERRAGQYKKHKQSIPIQQCRGKRKCLKCCRVFVKTHKYNFLCRRCS